MEINAETKRRLHEYIITQMSNFLRFLLAVNEIKDSSNETFDEVCTDIYYDQNISKYKHKYNYKCLWTIIFKELGRYISRSYTPILSAYCRKNKITTKHDLYIKMSDELESWINTIDRLDDISVIAFGITQKNDIWHIFSKYSRNYSNDVEITKFYRDSLDIIIKNDFENIYIDHDYAKIKHIKPIQNKYDDPWQHVFYKYIILYIMRDQPYSAKITPNDICAILSDIIYSNFNIDIQIHSTDANIMLNNIDQIIDYADSKIPQYPAEIKDDLSILASINRFINTFDKSTIVKLAKMAELSNYNLSNLPIDVIIRGCFGAAPIQCIPLEQIPDYYARLTQSYSGMNTKAAKRDLAF